MRHPREARGIGASAVLERLRSGARAGELGVLEFAPEWDCGRR